MARPASSRLLKSLGFSSLFAVTGGALLLARPSHTSQDHLRATTPSLKSNEHGSLIPPRFPKAKSREEQIADLKLASNNNPSGEIYDLLVIGGGATGTGIALDAVTRGLKVALVERDDFSSGTSSKSTKLVHGGVRYLEKAVWNLDYGQYSLVREALRERKNFLYTAPHLSSSLPILLPLQKWWQAPYFWAGTKCYDLLAGSQGLESSYFLTKAKALEAFPLLKKENLVGALVYYDGQHNDSRMNVSLAMTAALYGATTVNHLEVTGLEKDATGRLCGARVKDLISERDGDAQCGDEFVVRARGIINAAGPFVDAIEHMDDSKRKELVAPSSGTHVVLPGHLSPQRMGLLDASTSDGRVMFFLPWEGNIIAGTTDAPCSIEKNPSAKEEDISWILSEVRKYLSPEVSLQRSDVLAAWSGIRPLVRDPNSKNTESLVRNHLVNVSPSGLLTCAGGKWTTYRQMAEDAVDKAIEVFDLKPARMSQNFNVSGSFGANESALLDGSCQTQRLRLIGSHGYSPTMFIDLIRHFNLDADVAKHLAHSYGDRAWTVAALSTTDSAISRSPKPVTGQRLSPRYPIIDGEVRYAVQQEYAQTAADFLARRTRLSFLDAEAALAALPEVVDLMGAELGWTDIRKEREWTDTVQFLGSMGLPAGQLAVTRQEVLDRARSHQPTPHQQPTPILHPAPQVPHVIPANTHLPQPAEVAVGVSIGPMRQ